MVSPHLRRALRLYREIDRKLEPEAAKLNATCTKGCAACCYLLVGVTYAEARVIAEHVAALPRVKICDLRARLVDATGRLDSVRSRDAYLLRQVPCVFLRAGGEPWSGTCSIYGVRPLACRLHLVVSPPEHCAPDAIRDVAFVDTRFAHVRASLHLADPDDERATKYGPLAPLIVLALDEALEGTVPSLLELESWERKMERWSTRTGLLR
jgi:Fe-S-cluster containining protein